ncbi:MAG: hypothetical protein JW951_03580 [Lentisphaerae bacterium]|nr:hypothetical protein [Lentisphaerota bacterium]
MTGTGDLDICRAIRRLLVKHWIDLGQLSIRSTRGRVMLYGQLSRVDGAPTELSAPLVDAIFRELRRIDGVKTVRPHFQNWTQEIGGGWKRVEDARRTSWEPTA